MILLGCDAVVRRLDYSLVSPDGTKDPSDSWNNKEADSVRELIFLSLSFFVLINNELIIIKDHPRFFNFGGGLPILLFLPPDFEEGKRRNNSRRSICASP